MAPNLTCEICSDLSSLREEWELLEQEGRTATVFQTWQWLEAWWSVFGEGRTLAVVVAREGRRLVGLLPLYGEEEGGRVVLRFVGSGDLTDYLDLLASPGREEAVAGAISCCLEGPALAWANLTLRSVPAASPLLGPLKERWESQGWRVKVEQEDVCPTIHLEGSWESYLSGLPPKKRHELRRKLRKSEALAGVEWVRPGAGISLEAGLEEFFRLHALSSPEKGQFLDPPVLRFFRKFASSFYQAGWLDLTVLSTQGQAVSSLLSFRYKNVTYAYNSGYDPRYAAYSVGIAIFARAIRDALRRGDRKFDFLRGDEAYKYRLGAEDEAIFTLSVERG